MSTEDYLTQKIHELSDELREYRRLRYGNWQERCFKAERELERVTDELDSANERIAQLERKRDEYLELRENGLTGRTYGL